MLSDLRAYLLADGTVGGLVGTRMYPLKLPQSPTLPCISYTVISDVREHVMSGKDSLPQTRVQIDAWAETMSGVIALGDAITARLDAFSGTMNSGTVVGGIFADTYRLEYESDTELYRYSRDYNIFYEE